MNLKQYTSTTPNLGTSSKIIDVTVPAIDLNAYIASSPADYATATNVVFNNTYFVNHNFVDMLSSALTAANFNPETHVVVFGVINTSAANVGSIAVANNAFLDINANTINYGSDNAGDDSFVNQDGLRGQAVQNVALSS